MPPRSVYVGISQLVTCHRRQPVLAVCTAPYAMTQVYNDEIVHAHARANVFNASRKVG